MVIDIRLVLAAIAAYWLTTVAVNANFADLSLLEQMNRSHCEGNGGDWSGMSCNGGRRSGPIISAEDRARLERENATFSQGVTEVTEALQQPVDAARFTRRFPDLVLPAETAVTAPLFACLRQRIGGLLLSELAEMSYRDLVRVSGSGFHTSVNARDLYYWTQDILALTFGQDRFVLDFGQPAHRQIMIDLVLREAPRAWSELQAALATYDEDALLDDYPGSKATWFLSDLGLVHIQGVDDPSVTLGRSFYYPASCRNHTNGTRAKLIPVTGYYMDDRVQAFETDPSGTRLEGVLPFMAP